MRGGASDAKIYREMAICSYWDYDRHATITCPDCGWSGPAAQGEEAYAELLDVDCPRCDRGLLIVPFPAAEETRAAAAAGNPHAQAELPRVEKGEARVARAAGAEVKTGDQPAES